MIEPGSPVDVTGTLVRDEGGFVLLCEGKLTYHLQLHRVPVDEVEKQVRVTGRLIGDHLIEADGVARL